MSTSRRHTLSPLLVDIRLQHYVGLPVLACYGHAGFGVGCCDAHSACRPPRPSRSAAHGSIPLCFLSCTPIAAEAALSSSTRSYPQCGTNMRCQIVSRSLERILSTREVRQSWVWHHSCEGGGLVQKLRRGVQKVEAHGFEP